MREAIQICGISDREEAELVIEAGVEFLGFPLRLRDGREDLTEAAAREIVRALDGRAQGVAITYLSAANDIAELTDFLGVGWVQLHGEISTRELGRLRLARPDLRVIKSLVVGRDEEMRLVDAMGHLAEHVDAFITDTYDSATGRTGATGKVHDWNVSRRLVARSPRPVILAGGLHSENVREAIIEVAPAAVDAHTGVEGADGRKDRERLRAFVSAARAGFRELREVSGDVD